MLHPKKGDHLPYYDDNGESVGFIADIQGETYVLALLGADASWGKCEKAILEQGDCPCFRPEPPPVEATTPAEETPEESPHHGRKKRGHHGKGKSETEEVEQAGQEEAATQGPHEEG